MVAKRCNPQSGGESVTNEVLRAKYIDRVSRGLVVGATMEEQLEAFFTCGELAAPKVDPIAPKVKAAGAC